MTTVALHTAPDGLLAAVAPLGCALAAGIALVIDLDHLGVPLPGSRTLRDLVEEGPTGAELHPTRRGVASLPNGGVGPTEAAEVVDALRGSWPHVVLRVPDEEAVPDGVLGVALRPLLPGVTPGRRLPTLLQPLGFDARADAPQGPRMPRLSGRVARALLHGRTVRSPWVSAWSMVWDAA